MSKTFSKLTRAAMRRLQVNKSISEHGISFARRAAGDGVFTVNIMVDGQRIHRVVGRESDGTTRTQAEEYIEQVRQDAKHHRLTLPRGRKIGLSIREAASKYLERLEVEGGKDLQMKRRRLARHVVPFFGELPLSKVSTFDIERYKKSRQQEPARRGGDRRSQNARVSLLDTADPTMRRTSAGTVNRELAVLSHLMNKAIEWGWIDHRPARIKQLSENKGRIAYLTIAQMTALIECAKGDENAQVYPFIVIGLGTSMRLMEILSIRRDDVDLQRRVIYVPQAKAGAREQPITAQLATFLEGYIAQLPGHTPWLFPSASAKSGHTIDIRKPYRRAVEGAGLDPTEVVRHTLRHTAITHLVQAGVDLPTIKRISGHKTLQMVERYAHANGEHIAAAMDKLEQRYKEAS